MRSTGGEIWSLRRVPVMTGAVQWWRCGGCCRYVSLAELGVLQVDRVTAGDHGTYRCTATNDVRQRHSADARLTVLTAAATTGLSVSQSTCHAHTSPPPP